jgi:hypothetical protein
MLKKTLLLLAGAALAMNASPAPALGQGTGCMPPVPPFVPSDPRDIQSYADLLRQDFETYIADFEAYLRCLDTERARVFAEGQEVIQEYGRFQDLMRRLGPPRSAE